MATADLDYALGKTPARTPISPKPGKITDLSPSKGLAAGLKRVGGRKGTTRLGRENRINIGNARHGRPIVSHRF